MSIFLHGLRHISEPARIKADELKPGNALQISVELKGRLPPDYEPMSGPQFELITG